MQVTQTLAEGLKKEFKVVLPASDLAAKLESQLNEMRAEGPDQGLPSRKGANLAPQEALWQKTS